MDALETLRSQFIERCRADVERLRQLEPGDEETGRIVHRLAGAAGSFGYPEVSEVAADIDVRIRDGAPPQRSEIEHLMRAVETAFGEDEQPATI